MLNWWRCARTLTALVFLSSPAWPHYASLPLTRYIPAFLLMGFYLAFLEAFTLLVLFQRGRTRDYFRRFQFWRFTIRQHPVVFRLYAPDATLETVHILCGGFKNWAPVAMIPEKCNTGWWLLTLQLRPGRHEYTFRVGSSYRPDPNAYSTTPNPYGGLNSIVLSGMRAFPGSRVQIRNTSTQALIAVAGFLLAFGSAGASWPLPPLSAFSAILSIILGLLYNFVFGGSLDREEHNGRPHIVEVAALHDDLMELLLNLQVLSLVFSLALLGSPSTSLVSSEAYL